MLLTEAEGGACDCAGAPLSVSIIEASVPRQLILTAGLNAAASLGARRSRPLSRPRLFSCWRGRLF